MSSLTNTTPLVLPSIITTNGLLSILTRFGGFQALAQTARVSGLIACVTLAHVEIGKLEEGGTIYSAPGMPSPSKDGSVVARTESVVTQVRFPVTAETVRNPYPKMTDSWTLWGDWKYTDGRGLRTWGCLAPLPEPETTVTQSWRTLQWPFGR